MMLSLFFILLLAKGIDTRFEWHCSSFDPATDRFSLPNLEAQDDAVVHELALENMLVTSSPGLTYIYSVPSGDLNCSGTVRSIEYCYSGSVLHMGNEHHAFTLSILDQRRKSFRVLDTTEVYTMPTFGKCTQRQGTSTIYCCDVKSMIEMDQFQLPAPNFAFGITLPSSATTVLLGFSPIFRSSYIVTHYQTSLPLTMGSTLNMRSDNDISDQALKLLRFRIQPNSATQISTPASRTEEQPSIGDLFTPNNGPTPSHEVSTNEGPDYSTIPPGIEAITEGYTTAVTNRSSSGLSTVVKASIVTVGGSAILLTCALVLLAIVIAKIQKRNNTSAMEDLTVRQYSVPTNNNHVETDVDSIIFDDEIYSTAPKL